MHLSGYRYVTLGSLHAQFGQLEQAINAYRQALLSFRRENDRVNIGNMLNRLGELHAVHGNLRKTRTLCQAAARIFRQMDHTAGAITAVRNVAMVHYQAQRYPLALHLLEKVLMDCDASGDTFNEAITLTCMAQVYLSQSKYLFALACHEAAIELFQAIEHFDRLDDAAYRVGLR
ncbi:MAG: hypothetical protein AAFU71_16335 [Cyanobacteria bacterium J06632_22]